MASTLVPDHKSVQNAAAKGAGKCHFGVLALVVPRRVPGQGGMESKQLTHP